MILFVFLSVVLGSLTYFTVVSPSTPLPLLSLLDANAKLTAQTLAETLLFNSPDLLLDAAFEDLTTAWLSSYSEETQVPLLVLGPVAKPQRGNWTFHLGMTYEEMASAVDEALSCLDLQQVSLVSDASASSQALRAALGRVPRTVLYEHHMFASEQSPRSFFGKLVRPTGNRMTVFITSALTTKVLLKEQFHMHIGGWGYANLLAPFSALYTLSSNDTERNLAEGELLLAQEDDMWITSDSDMYTQQYRIVKSFLTSSPELLKTALNMYFASPRRYVVINVHNSTRNLVLRLSTGNCSLATPIYFLGGSLGLPASYSAPIAVSANFGPRNPEGRYFPILAETSGAILAMEEVNNRTDLLPNFELDLWNFTGGVSSFNASVFEATVMPYRDKFGAALLPSFVSSQTINMMRYLRTHGVLTPFVGATTTQDSLSSPTDYPGFIRVCARDSYVNVVIVQTLKKLGWTACSLLVLDKQIGSDAQRDFKHLLEQTGITIANDPQYQVISSSVTSLEEARVNFTKAFQHIIDTKCRIVILVTTPISHYIPIVFYELGIRKGDLVLFGREAWTIPSLSDTWDEVQTAQGLEVMRGSLQLQPDYVGGQVKSAFLTNYAKRFSYSPNFAYACGYYDAVYAITYALQWLLVTGKDFLNATEMDKALHELRYIGCSGLIDFNAKSNDRQTMRFTLNTLGSNDSLTPVERTVGWFDPTGVVLLKMDPSFLWGDDTAKIPSTFRESTLGCPFEDRFIRSFSQGLHVFQGICLGLLGLTALLGGAYYWRFNTPLSLLDSRLELALEDGLVMIGLAVESAQLLGLLGDFSFVSVGLQNVLDVLIGNFGAHRSLQEDRFTHLWLVAESLAAGWLLVVLLLRYLPCVLGQGVLQVLLELLAFAFANWAIVPEVFILLGSFECTEGTSEVDGTPTFLSSYLAADCYLSCWQGLHLCIAVLSFCTLCVLLICSGLYRLLWQATSPLLHIHTNVLFFQVKAFVQVLQVVLFRIFENTTLRASLILGTRFCCACLPLVIQTYGYGRVRLWHLASEVALLWAAIVNICHLEAAISDKVGIILLAIGWVCSAACAFAYQLWKVPSLLYRPKGIDTTSLYKFAFKPTTTEIINNLQFQFQKSNKLCSFVSAHYVTGQANVSEEVQVREPQSSDSIQLQRAGRFES